MGQDSSSFVRVFSDLVVTRAHIVRGALEAAGIPCRVLGEGRSTLAGAIPLEACYTEVWVPSSRHKEAQSIVDEIIANHEQAGFVSLAPELPMDGALSPSESSGEWGCSCGESNPNNFGSCWACGKDR